MRKLLGTLAAASLLGAAGVASTPSFAPSFAPSAPIVVRTSTAVTGPSTQSPAPASARVQSPSRAARRYRRFYRTQGAVWNGRAKRGNRRNRSRWNYGR